MTPAVPIASDASWVYFGSNNANPRIFVPAAGSDLAINYAAGIIEDPLRVSIGMARAILADLRTIDSTVATLFEAVLASASPARTLGLNEHQWTVVERCLEVERERDLRTAYIAEPLLRADLLHAHAGERLIELNYTPACGGFDEQLVFEALVGRGTVELDASEDWRHGEVLRGLVDKLLALTGGTPGIVCLLDSVTSYVSYRPRLELLAGLLASFGIDTVHADMDGVVVGADGCLQHTESGRRIDTIWRFFMLDEIQTSEDATAAMHLLEPWADANCNLFGSVVEEAKSSKSVLAWLWADKTLELRNSGLIPETYVLGSGNDALAGGEPADAARTAAVVNPAAWVLKDPFGHGGVGVLIGEDTTREIWEERIVEAVSGSRPAVLQRRIQEASLRVNAHTSPHRESRLNLGVFLNASNHGVVDGNGGMFVRIALQDEAKIGLSNGAVTGIALIEDDQRGRP
jgi:hypothetical protein